MIQNVRGMHKVKYFKLHNVLNFFPFNWICKKTFRIKFFDLLTPSRGLGYVNICLLHPC